MKKLMATTALAAMLAMPALAQTMGVSEGFLQTAAAEDLRASEFIGKRVYVAETEVMGDPVNEADAGWTDIGEVNDVILSRDGQAQAILVDVGGFLGIGEKTVAVSMGELRLVQDGDTAGDYFVVFTSTRTDLEAAPAFVMGADAGAQADANADAAAQAESQTTAPEVPATDPAADPMVPAVPAPDPAVDPETGAVMEEGRMMDVSTMTADQLEGAPVFDATNERVGDVSQVIIDDQGVVQQAVIDIGGFLGIGAKPVAFGFEQLTIRGDENGENLRVYVASTREEMEAMPDYVE